MIIIFQIIEKIENEEHRKTAHDIFLRYQDYIYNIANNILRNSDDAEDAMIETAIAVCRHIDKFICKPEKELKAMLYTYTERIAIRVYNSNKKHKKNIVSYDEVFNYVFCDEDTENNEIHEEEVDIDFQFDINLFGEMQKHIKKLDEKYKTILVLKFVNEHKNFEIAEILGIPESTVSTRLNRAIEKLKQMCDDEKSSQER